MQKKMMADSRNGESWGHRGHSKAAVLVLKRKERPGKTGQNRTKRGEGLAKTWKGGRGKCAYEQVRRRPAVGRGKRVSETSTGVKDIQEGKEQI